MSLAQWEVPLEVHNILECANISQDSLPSEKMAAILSDIRYIRDLTSRFKQLSVDKTEYACLKAIVIFRPGKCTVTLLINSYQTILEYKDTNLGLVAK